MKAKRYGECLNVPLAKRWSDSKDELIRREIIGFLRLQVRLARAPTGTRTAIAGAAEVQHELERELDRMHSDLAPRSALGLMRQVASGFPVAADTEVDRLYPFMDLAADLLSLSLSSLSLSAPHEDSSDHAPSVKRRRASPGSAWERLIARVASPNPPLSWYVILLL